MSKIWICTLVVFGTFKSQLAFAQENIKIRRDGKLVSVQIYKSDPIRIFIRLKDKSKLDMDQVTLVVKNKTSKNDNILRLDRETNHFIIDEEIDLRKPLNLEVTTKVNNQSETLNFKVQ
jgi:hypothetical protein